MGHSMAEPSAAHPLLAATDPFADPEWDGSVISCSQAIHLPVVTRF
jgi:hypothetical protein